jgi:hypothetical protein
VFSEVLAEENYEGKGNHGATKDSSTLHVRMPPFRTTSLCFALLTFLSHVAANSISILQEGRLLKLGIIICPREKRLAT